MTCIISKLTEYVLHCYVVHTYVESNNHRIMLAIKVANLPSYKHVMKQRSFYQSGKGIHLSND